MTFNKGTHVALFDKVNSELKGDIGKKLKMSKGFSIEKLPKVVVDIGKTMCTAMRQVEEKSDAMSRELELSRRALREWLMRIEVVRKRFLPYIWNL